MTMTFETLTIERPHADVLLITLNRPDAANAINTQMAKDLLVLFTSLASDEIGVRAVVLTGAGSKIFCAGGDLKERNGMSDEAWVHQHRIMEQALFCMHDTAVPIIAAVNGAAIGGGCELALAADFAYASNNARFALSETSLGIMPGAGGTQNLPRAVGLRRANEIIFSADRFTAEEALLWGVVNRLFSQEELVESAVTMAARIAENAPLAVRQAKKAMREGLTIPKRDALQFEIDLYHALVQTRDRQEGVLAFNEKRKPECEGR